MNFEEKGFDIEDGKAFLDSLDRVEMVLTLEREYPNVNSEEFEDFIEKTYNIDNMFSLSDIADFLQENV